jgi:hypothetical protein
MVTNSTLSQNSAGNGGFGASGGAGGGITYGFGREPIVTNSTLSQNSAGSSNCPRCEVTLGGGLDGGATLRNTIVANSLAGGNCNHRGTLTDDGYNLSSDDTCTFSAPTSLTNTDPLLLPLQNNGGPTDTYALCTGAGTPDASCPGASPALDAIPAGTNGCGTDVITDQRGVSRPQDAGCEIGAVEVGPVPEVEVVNSRITFVPTLSTFATTADTSGCPAAVSGGKFSFSARLTNSNASGVLSDLVVEVQALPPTPHRCAL